MGSGSVTKKMRRIKSRNKMILRIKKRIEAAKAARGNVRGGREGGTKKGA